MLIKKKKNTPLTGTIDTLIGANTIISGNIETKGSLKIEGKVQGNIAATGDISLGKNALVLGDVYAKNVEVNGVIEGNIYADGLLRISSSAKLFGDVEVESFVSDQGALFEGKCAMREPVSSENKVLATDNDMSPTQVRDENDEASISEANNTQNYKKSSLLDENNKDTR